MLGQIEHQERQRQHGDDQRVGLPAAFSRRDAFAEHIKDAGRGHVPVVKDQRRAEVGERPDKNDAPAREHAGQHQRQGDLAKQPPAGVAQVARGMLKARVHVGQGRCQVQVHDRIQVQDFENHYAPETCPAQDVQRLFQARVGQHQVQRTVFRQQPAHADGPDERRYDHRQEKQAAEQRLAPKAKPDGNKRQRQGHRHGQKRHGGGEDQAVCQPTLFARCRVVGAGEQATQRPGTDGPDDSAGEIGAPESASSAQRPRPCDRRADCERDQQR